MDNQLVFRSWARFFVITMLMGGALYVALAWGTALTLGVMLGIEGDSPPVIAAILPAVFGLGGFAWVSYLAYLRTTQALFQRLGAAHQAALPDGPQTPRR